jgi:effector-binding domain-containing protein
VSYAVQVEEVGPRVLAAARGSATRANLGPTIIRLLDQVWPVLRAQGLRTDHNIVVYHGGLHDIEAGVEVVGGQLAETDVVKQARTPAGLVATVSHFGDYAAVGAAYAALERHCQEHKLARTPISWEVYGDWSDNPAEQRMDVYWLLAAPGCT